MVRAGPEVGPTWEGPMVVSGDLTVRAVVDGTEKELMQSISIDPRGWPDLGTVQLEVLEVRCPAVSLDCPLLHPPVAFGHLGVYRAFADTVLLTDAAESVAEGPNRGWLYVAGDDSPYDQARSVIFINAALVDSNDPFFKFHDGKDGRCEIDELHEFVVAHEEAHHEFFLRRLRTAVIGPFLDAFFAFKPEADFIVDLKRMQDSFQSLAPPPDLDLEHDAIARIVPLRCLIDFDTPSPTATEVN